MEQLERHEKSYLKNKSNLLSDKSINEANRQLFAVFFERKERELRRLNEPELVLDYKNYKTLNTYISKFRNVNNWVENKPIKELDKETLRKILNDFVDGKLLGTKGKKPSDRKGYFSRIFKSKLFKIAGLNGVVEEIIEEDGLPVRRKQKPVRYFNDKTYEKLIGGVSNRKHKLLLMCLWEFPENIGTQILIEKRDFEKGIVEGEPCYKLKLRKEILKRSRKSRTLETYNKELINLLDKFLAEINETDRLFPISLGGSEKIVSRAVKNSGAKLEGSNIDKKITAKDFRSSRTSDLVSKGIPIDDVKKILGHSASSRAIDVYVELHNLKINGSVRNKLKELKVEELKDEINAMREREKIYVNKIEDMGKQILEIKSLL